MKKKKKKREKKPWMLYPLVDNILIGFLGINFLLFLFIACLCNGMRRRMEEIFSLL